MRHWALKTSRISKKLLNIENDIISKVRMVSELKMDNLKKRTENYKITEPLLVEEETSEESEEERGAEAFEVVAIGSSTGGPPALQHLLCSLPKDIPLSIVVSQHMPPGFTKAFAERLNRLSGFEV